MSQLLLYGANGYTGRLIAEEARRRGLPVVLAGRDAAAVATLSQSLDLPYRAFALDDAAAVSANLDGITAVLHCAGPFSRTCAPMLAACLERRVHYLDITGEVEVFAHCHRHDAQARAAGIVVLPGAGFDVVPTDCLAVMLKQRLPSATRLVLAFEAGGGPSPGTARTSVEGLAGGGRARIDGELRRVPLAWKVRRFERDGAARTAMTIPWGDLQTAFVSTGIPNIETYMAVPPATIARMRRMRLLRPLLALAPVQRWLKRRVDRQVRGPGAGRRAGSGCHVWGEVSDDRGAVRRLALSGPNGYDLTVTAALGIAERVLAGGVTGGYYTPAMLMGADYVLGLPGVSLVESGA